jgi:polyisoprenoid-binding protein YceI
MKRLAIILVLSVIFLNANSQKFITKNGYIGFHSNTPVEDIKADNNQVAGVIDPSTGEMVFQVLIKSFHFEKALMEEHFNENYMESDKFPKATFSGKISNLSDVSFSKPGTYDVGVEGDLTIHGVTNKVKEKGKLEISAEGINATSTFNLIPEDYKIDIPGVVRASIAKTLEVTVNMKFTPLEKK